MLTQDLLNEIFKYDPETGVLERQVPARNESNRWGDTTSSSYPCITVGSRPHRIHRIIWLMVYGSIPKGKAVDHINGNKHDNRLCNLRLASTLENNMNQGKSSRNTTGFKGVSRDYDKFRAYINIGGKYTHLGRFPSAHEAAEAYDKAAIEHFGEFARTNSMMGLLPNISANA